MSYCKVTVWDNGDTTECCKPAVGDTGMCSGCLEFRVSQLKSSVENAEAEAREKRAEYIRLSTALNPGFATMYQAQSHEAIIEELHGRIEGMERWTMRARTTLGIRGKDELVHDAITRVVAEVASLKEQLRALDDLREAWVLLYQLIPWDSGISKTAHVLAENIGKILRKPGEKP